MSLMQSGGSSSIKMGAKFADSLASRWARRPPISASPVRRIAAAASGCTTACRAAVGTLLSPSADDHHGNAVGIYVHGVQKSSLADAAGMRMSDQILEYNGADLRRVTAEQAANEISRPAEAMKIVVQHNLKSKCAYLDG